MRLLATNILVKQDPSEEKTLSGIYLPEQAQKKINRGTIVLVGPGLKEEPMTVKPDERIQFGAFCGITTDYNGETHLIMRQSDIQAVIG